MARFQTGSDIEIAMEDFAGAWLPTRVAYSNKFMREHRSLCKGYHEIPCSRLFEHYPYNFTSRGTRRIPQELSQSEYDLLIERFGASEDSSKQKSARPSSRISKSKQHKEDQTTTQNDEVSKNAADMEGNIFLAPQNLFILPEDAYGRAMRTLRDSELLSSKEVDDLNEKLRHTEEELADCKTTIFSLHQVAQTKDEEIRELEGKLRSADNAAKLEMQKTRKPKNSFGIFAPQ